MTEGGDGERAVSGDVPAGRVGADGGRYNAGRRRGGSAAAVPPVVAPTATAFCLATPLGADGGGVVPSSATTASRLSRHDSSVSSSPSGSGPMPGGMCHTSTTCPGRAGASSDTWCSVSVAPRTTAKPSCHTFRFCVLCFVQRAAYRVAIAPRATAQDKAWRAASCAQIATLPRL